MYFQDVILTLQNYWANQGCVIEQPSGVECGAGTFNPNTFLRVIGPEPWSVAYVEPSRRPTDGRYGENPNRLQRYFQFQVIMKPSPDNVQDLYLQSLKALGITYGHIYHQNEVEQSRHNFEASNPEMLLRHFSDFEGQCKALLEQGLPWPAYDYCLKCSHTFNLLDARGAISITERTGYIGRVRALAAGVARLYAAQREELGYPMLKKDAR